MAKVPGNERTRKLMLASEDELWAAFKKAEEFAQMGDRGDVRENRLASFLQEQLPTRYSVVSGEVIDAEGNQSGQTDILIFDGANTRPLFTSGDVAMLPAEALLATVEVKSKLNKLETGRSTDAMVKMRALKPWDAPWAVARQGGAAAVDGLPRIFATLFAYDTDLVASTWAETEMGRVRGCAETSKLAPQYLDRVVVLTRGILLPGSGRAYVAAEERGALGLWFLQLVAFLSRETARREAFPWERYMWQEGRLWKSVADPAAELGAQRRASASERSKARETRRSRRKKP